MLRMLKIIIMVSLLLSSGCGFKDIDKRFFVVAIGVDKGKAKKYEVTLKLVIPSPSIESERSEFELISRETDNISEAIKSLSSDVDKQLDMGHAKIIIFSREIGQENIKEAFQGFIRRRDIQKIEYLALGEPSAKDILALSPKSERLAANSMLLLFEQGGSESPYIITEYMYEFYRRMLEKGMDPFLPIITKKEETFEISRVALFNKKKIVMTLTKEQTGIFNQLVRKQSNFEIVASKAGLSYALSVEDFNYKYHINDTNNPQINMMITINAIVEESNQSLFDENWTRLERIAEEQMREQYLTLLEELRRRKIDPLGFGLRYIATHHNGEMDWEEWHRIYPKVKFNVKVNVILSGTGVIK